MRFLAASALCALLAACGQPPMGEAEASAPDVLTGRYRAASDSAATLTGNLSLERGGLIFDRGVVLYTRPLLPRSASERVAQDGDNYAAILVSGADVIVELRHVVEQTLSNGAQGLCGEDEPTYVAIAPEERGTSVTLLVFAGDQAPGPTATRSRLCGAFKYVAPNGARTREGVVLW